MSSRDVDILKQESTGSTTSLNSWGFLRRRCCLSAVNPRIGDIQVDEIRASCAMCPASCRAVSASLFEAAFESYQNIEIRNNIGQVDELAGAFEFYLPAWTANNNTTQ